MSTATTILDPILVVNERVALVLGCGAGSPGGKGFSKGNTCQKKGSGGGKSEKSGDAPGAVAGGGRSTRSKVRNSKQITKDNKRRKILGLPSLLRTKNAKIKPNVKPFLAKKKESALKVLKSQQNKFAPANPEFKAKAKRINEGAKAAFAEEQRLKPINAKRKKAGLPAIKTTLQKASEARGNSAEAKRQAMFAKANKSLTAAKIRAQFKSGSPLDKGQKKAKSSLGKQKKDALALILKRQKSSKVSLGKQRKKALTDIAEGKGVATAKGKAGKAVLRQRVAAEVANVRKGRRLATRAASGVRRGVRGDGRGRQKVTDEQIIEQEKERVRRAKLRKTVTQ